MVTLMTDEQVRDVRDLTRKAGIKPTTTRVAPASNRASTSSTEQTDGNLRARRL